MASTAAVPAQDWDLNDGAVAGFENEEDGQGEEDQENDEQQQPEELTCPEVEPETQKATTGPFVYKPTAEEVELHRSNHHPYRPWCEWCIRGKAIGEQHVRSTHVSDVPVIASDYFYLTSGEGDIGVNVKLRSEIDMDDETLEVERREGRLVKCLIFRCHMSKAIFAWVVPY